jgi:Ca2+-transporting ATPase
VDLVIPAAELVRGDLVHLEPGDVVPADLSLRAAHRLRLDEAALTGESVRVARSPGEESLAGTVVVDGRASGTVLRTGPASALGRVAALVLTTTSGPTPLQRRLAALSRTLGVIAVVLSAVVFVIGVASGRSVVVMAITAVSLVVAAVPESLPAVVTLALALGARRMAAANAIPRRLHAVETLGSVTVVASDKTGTLTEGRMAVLRAVTGDGSRYRVHGVGYSPVGELRDDGDRTVPVVAPDVRDLARAGLLCNDAALNPPGDDQPYWTAVGDPLEAALVAFAGRCGLAIADERAAYPRVAEQPFAQGVRRMITVHRRPHGGFLVVCKGAPESVLTVPLVGVADAAASARLLAEADRLAKDGLRVLALAAAETTDRPHAEMVRDLRPIGVIGVGDPVREAAPTVVDAFARAGVRTVLITGDHPATAAAIGGRLGILRDGDAVAGDLAGITPEAADRATVFARVQPEQKLDIVAALQTRGHVVAMTGDGVNDAPALRRADIGVAMGGGTEVARQAADLVLVDDNLATVGAAVREGRRIYDNIRRFLHYALAGGLAEILVMLFGPFLGLAVPLLPAQILWVNLLTHGVPGVALGAEPAEPGTMSRSPRSPRESVLGGGLARSVLLSGLLLAAVVLGVGVGADAFDRPWQSMIFVTLGLAQLGIALAVRAPRRAGERHNAALPVAVAASAALQLAGVLVGPLRDLLGTDPLAAADVLVCVAASVLPGLAIGIPVRWARRSAGPVATQHAGPGQP